MVKLAQLHRNLSFSKAVALKQSFFPPIYTSQIRMSETIVKYLVNKCQSM